MRRNKMKKIIAVAVTVALIFSINFSSAFAADETCILIKFSNDTRYKSLDTAAVLSELVLEKLLANGFNINESKPIDEDMEQKLFYEKSAELANAERALANKNLSLIFEGPAFDDSQAQTIGTADVGQIISPSITSQIGRAHNAKYLIQGNIINMGNGAWEDSEASKAAQLFGVAASRAGLPLPIPSISQKKAGIGIQTDLRIIKASTGEVIWRKIVTGKHTTTRTDVGMFKFGSAKLTSEIYSKALEDAVEQISTALITDFKAHKLFVK